MGLFRDPEPGPGGAARPVARYKLKLTIHCFCTALIYCSLSFCPAGQNLAIAYCSLEFQALTEETPRTSFVFCLG